MYIFNNNIYSDKIEEFIFASREFYYFNKIGMNINYFKIFFVVISSGIFVISDLSSFMNFDGVMFLVSGNVLVLVFGDVLCLFLQKSEMGIV